MSGFRASCAFGLTDGDMSFMIFASDFDRLQWRRYKSGGHAEYTAMLAPALRYQYQGRSTKVRWTARQPSPMTAPRAKTNCNWVSAAPQTMSSPMFLPSNGSSGAP